MARIIVITSGGEETLELAPGQTLTVGRDPANKVPLPTEAGLSRRHCRIGPREGGEEGWEVADLGSTNKTRVNGQTVQHKVLAHGDEIEIGSVKIRFEDPDEEKRLEALGKEGVCYLEWVSKEHKGERIVLTRKQTTVGRRDTNDVALDDRMVSGHHAEIDRDVNGYTIRDLGSTNGTLVNGQPISEALLTHGARIRIGNSRFAFKDPSMQDVEVELAHFEEDDGWGMMGEIDVSHARGSRMGILVVALLFLAAGAGGWWLMQQEERGAGGKDVARAGLIENGDFEDDVVPWSADREEGVEVRRREKGGRPDAWLSVSNLGPEGEGLARVTYDRGIETTGSRPLRVQALVKASGGGDAGDAGGAELVAVWASEPTPEELKAGVTDLERSDLLFAPTGAWGSVDTVLVPPVWARTLRIGLRLPEGAGAGIDTLSVTPEGQHEERPEMSVRTFKTATIDESGSLDLVGNRRILLTGVRPVARLPGGRVLTDFRATELEVGDEEAALEGTFANEEGEGIPAALTWKTTVEGLRAELRCEPAEAVGFDAGVPAAHVGGTVSVLGDFLPQRVPVTADEPRGKVSRTLVGDPVGGATGRGTLIAFVQPGDAAVATLEFLPSRDAGLVVFRHWVAGSKASLEVISDFTKQRSQAEQALTQARKLAFTAPGRAIQELSNVANAFPFEEQVRDEALRLASELETKAIADVQALDSALADYRIYRSGEALAKMEGLTVELAERFLGAAGRGGRLEAEISELVAEAREARKEYDVEHALPGVDRLERIAVLLSDSKGYQPMAALYWRTLLRRYGDLGKDAPDIARRLEAARQKLGDLEKIAEVQEALPPVPKAK